jgi:hypothetical protein
LGSKKVHVCRKSRILIIFLVEFFESSRYIGQDQLTFTLKDEYIRVVPLLFSHNNEDYILDMNDIVLTSKKIPKVNDPIDHASLWLWNSDTNTRGGQCRFEDGYFRKKFDNYDEFDVYVRNLKSV